MNPTRPYGDIFEYDPTPLGPGERAAVQCSSNAAPWTPTLRQPATRPTARLEANTGKTGARTGQTSREASSGRDTATSRLSMHVGVHTSPA